MIKKIEPLLIQFSKYFGVALIGLGFDFGSLIFFHEVVGLHYLIAATLGFLIGLFVNYILSNRFVFKNPKINSATIQFLSFAVIGLIGLGLLNLLMWAFTDGLGINYILSKFAATVFVYCWNFFARRALYNN